MNKEQKIQNMKDQPLNFPYADYEYPRSFDTSTAYLLATDVLEEERAVELGVPADYIAPLPIACWQAAKFFNQTVAMNGDPYIYVANLIHVHKSLLSKIANLERPLTLLPDTIAAIAHQYMGVSAHYLMFGEQTDLKLPNVFAVLAQKLEALREPVLSELETLAGEFLKRSEKKYPETYEGGPHRVYAQLARERMQQILYTNATAALYMLGDDLSPRLKNILRIYFSEDINPKTQVIMYIAWAMKDWPLDYYLCEHPLKHCDCYYLTAEGDRHVVTDTQIRTILDSLFALDDEDREIFMGQCYKKVFEEMLK